MNYTEVITQAVLHEDWSAYDERKQAEGKHPNLYTGEPWEVRFLDDLLQDAYNYEEDKGVLAAIFLSCAELKPPRQRADFVRLVVDKLFR